MDIKELTNLLQLLEKTNGIQEAFQLLEKTTDEEFRITIQDFLKNIQQVRTTIEAINHGDFSVGIPYTIFFRELLSLRTTLDMLNTFLGAIQEEEFGIPPPTFMGDLGSTISGLYYNIEEERNIRLQQTEELQKTKDILTMVLQSVVNGIIVVNLDGIVQYTNSQTLQLLELHEIPPKNRKIADYLPIHVQEWLKDKLDSTYLTENPHANFKFQQVSEDKSIRTIDLVLSNIKDMKGDIQYAILILHDITPFVEREKYIQSVRHHLSCCDNLNYAFYHFGSQGLNPVVYTGLDFVKKEEKLEFLLRLGGFFSSAVGQGDWRKSSGLSGPFPVLNYPFSSLVYAAAKTTKKKKKASEPVEDFILLVIMIPKEFEYLFIGRESMSEFIAAHLQKIPFIEEITEEFLKDLVCKFINQPFPMKTIQRPTSLNETEK